MESIRKGEPRSLSAYLGSDLHSKKDKRGEKKSQVFQNQTTGKKEQSELNFTKAHRFCTGLLEF